MRLRTAPLLLLTTALLASACSGSNGQATPSLPPASTATSDAAELDAPTSEQRDAYNAVFDELTESGFNGIIAVSSGGNVDTRGFGNADNENATAITGDTVFDIGSITKQFTGAAILRLQMDGLISVEDPIGDYLDLPPDKAAITIHQLLTHTAGLPDAIGDDYDPIDRSTYIDAVASLDLDNAPGTVHEYSNVGYSLLGAVIEIVTGDSYEIYLRSALFEPSGMDDTGYVLPDWDARSVAVGYLDGTALGRPHEQRWADDGPYWNLRANGGILSTANDMLRWHEALLRDDILDAPTKDAYYFPHVAEGPSEASFYSYGWAIVPFEDGGKLITHNGGNDVFFADFLRFIDDDLTIFLATNEADARFESAAFDVARTMLDFEAPGGANADCPVVRVEEYRAFPPLSELPDTDQARAANRLFTFFDTPPGPTSESTATSIVSDGISPALAPGVSSEDLVVEALAIQTELEAFEVADYIAIDELTFGARFEAVEGSLAIVITLTEEPTPRVACLSIED